MLAGSYSDEVRDSLRCLKSFLNTEPLGLFIGWVPSAVVHEKCTNFLDFARLLSRNSQTRFMLEHAPAALWPWENITYLKLVRK